jgi:hydroxyacylglutathione hydrolase
MFKIKTFSFNPFQENTYLLYNEANQGILIDPGCFERGEESELDSFLSVNNIELKLLLNTHAHIDHVLGYSYVNKTYNLVTRLHASELEVFRAVKVYAPNYGFNYEEGPEPTDLLQDLEIIKFGEDELKVLLCPGHSPGSVVFYCEKQHFAIAGDVLFYRSIGRTDLPGGDHATLLRSIKNNLYTLPNDTIIYPGHGPQTTIGSEKMYNPFVNM